MESVTVSPKFQVVIPQKARNLLGVKAGQKMTVLAYDNRLVFIPTRPIKEARGSLKGMDSNIEREEEDRV
jgi:AbrB family looped-hinge helix DNA binding protein